MSVPLSDDALKMYYWSLDFALDANNEPVEGGPDFSLQQLLDFYAGCTIRGDEGWCDCGCWNPTEYECTDLCFCPCDGDCEPFQTFYRDDLIRALIEEVQYMRAGGVYYGDEHAELAPEVSAAPPPSPSPVKAVMYGVLALFTAGRVLSFKR